ncbi:MAG: hypothetical protein AB1782_20000 [Cyanobacteriota bacterium]
MNIKMHSSNTFQPVNLAGNIRFTGPKCHNCCGDQLCLSSKATQKKDPVSFEGLWGKLFPPKVSKKTLEEYMALVKMDPMLKQTAQLKYEYGKYPTVHFTPGEKEFTFDIGFTNIKKEFKKQVSGKVNTDTRIVEFKSLDGLDHKPGDVKYAVERAIEDAIWVYKKSALLLDGEINYSSGN